MKKQAIIITLCIAAVLVSVSAVSAADSYVNGSVTSSGDGSSWEQAVQTIKEGYNIVTDDSTMYIAAGTYSGDDNKNIFIQKNITIQGAGEDQTTINCEDSGRAFTVNTGKTVTIKELTIENGLDGVAGGISNLGNLTVENCNFEDNNAFVGGAIYSYGENSILTVSGSTFTGNSADVGSAIYNTGTLTATGCNFNSNYGATISNANGLCTVKDSIFNSNDKAIENYYSSSTMTVSGCTFTGHTNVAIENYIASLTVTDSKFIINTGSNGAAILNSGTLIVSGCEFEKNTATYDGGAIANYGSTLTVTDSIFKENNAVNGGAIANILEMGNKPSMTITNSNFQKNSASNNGGAISNWIGDCTVTDSIFNGNTAGAGGAVFNYGGLNTITGSNLYSNQANSNGGAIFDAGGKSIIKYSRLVGNTQNDIYLEYGSLEAQLNWWGNNNGPETGRIAGNAETQIKPEMYTPWLVMNIKADPSTINTGQTSTITVDVYKDSASGDHSADAAQFFSGPQVTFTTDLGNVGSKSVTVNWDHGKAVVVLKADEGPGLATITAQNIQKVQTTVNILQAPITPPEPVTPQEPTKPSGNEVNALTVTEGTVGMQETGLPIAGLILAMLAVFGGLLVQKRK